MVNGDSFRLSKRQTNWHIHLNLLGIEWTPRFAVLHTTTLWPESLVEVNNKAAGQRRRHDIMVEEGNKERLPAIVLPPCSGLGNIPLQLPVAQRPHTLPASVLTLRCCLFYLSFGQFIMTFLNTFFMLHVDGTADTDRKQNIQCWWLCVNNRGLFFFFLAAELSIAILLNNANTFSINNVSTENLLSSVKCCCFFWKRTHCLFASHVLHWQTFQLFPAARAFASSSPQAAGHFEKKGICAVLCCYLDQHYAVTWQKHRLLPGQAKAGDGK